MLFHWKFTELTPIVIVDIWPYLWYSVSAFCLGVMSCCLFCVCLCFALWLVFWFLSSSIVIWNTDILFFKLYLWLFFKLYLWLLSFSNHMWTYISKNIKFMNETKTFDSHYGLLRTWYVYILRLFPRLLSGPYWSGV